MPPPCSPPCASSRPGCEAPSRLRTKPTAIAMMRPFEADPAGTTAAGVATQPLELRFGDTSVSVAVPIELERHVDAEALLRDAEAPEPPYWLHLWTGSRALARTVAERGGWQGLRVADVGCGLR